MRKASITYTNLIKRVKEDKKSGLPNHPRKTMDLLVSFIAGLMKKIEYAVQRLGKDAYNVFHSADENLEDLLPQTDVPSEEDEDDLVNPAEEEQNKSDTAAESGKTTKRHCSHRRSTETGHTARKAETYPVSGHIFEEVPEDMRFCEHCGAPLKPCGTTTSVKWFFEFRLKKVLVESERLVCRHCGRDELVQKSKPVNVPKFLPGSTPGYSLLAFVAWAKFGCSLPLYRMENMFSSMGFFWSRSTLCDWLLTAAERMEPLFDLFLRHLRGSAIVNMDETTLRCIHDPAHGEGEIKKSQMWVASCRGEDENHNLRIYWYDPTRSADVPLRLLQGFSGTLQTDGLQSYRKAVRLHGGIVHVGCLVHVRRHFVNVLKGLPKADRRERGGSAVKVVELINRIYKIERGLREREAPPSEILCTRRMAVLPIFEEIHKILVSLDGRAALTSMQAAITYALGQWDIVLNYLDNPRLTPDNNSAEHTVKPFVVGRKNWLFCQTPRGARAVSFFYTLIESAKVNGLDPLLYLKYVFLNYVEAERHGRLEELLPWRLTNEVMQDAEDNYWRDGKRRWKARHPEKAPEPAPHLRGSQLNPAGICCPA